MTVDKRELILTRIAPATGSILHSLGLFETVVRNRGLLDQDMRPAAALLDGDEVARLTGDRRGRQRMSPELVTMRPQVFMVIKSRKPQNVGVGEEINQFRLAVMLAIAKDQQLLDLVGSNGNISYEGCETDLKSGSAADGQMRLDFAITYVMDPYQT